MDEIDRLFKEQEELEDMVNLKAMLIQISINLVFTLSVLILFSWLRPRHAFIYAPKAKLSKYDPRRPTTLDSGWFDWIKPVFKIKDDALLELIGFDAYVFIYFTKMLRKLIYILTTISMFVFLPVNIVATYSTGDWPPAPGLDFMSISAMNYQDGKESKIPNKIWYWSPAIATYIFSAIIVCQMIRSSENFLKFRQRYYLKREKIIRQQLPPSSPIELLQQQKQDLIDRTLLVHFEYASLQRATRQIIPTFTANDDLKQLVDSMTNLPCEQVMIGKYNSKLYQLVNDYNKIIKKLEKHLNAYLYLIKEQQLKMTCRRGNEEQNVNLTSTATVKRPTIRLDWKSTKKIDAINYYTERALFLDTAIRRNRARLQNCNYGWVVYSSSSVAHESFVSIEKHIPRIRKRPSISGTDQCISLRLAPQPEDIIWANMNIERKTVQLKRWFGYGLFFSIIFIWSVPIAMLAVTSNMINLVRFFPESDQIIDDHQLIMGLIQSYLTPCLMVLFHVGLPELLRLVSRQQAYKTKTIVEQRLLSKLYCIFVINNLSVFSLVNMMLGILGQISALVILGTLLSKDLSDYVVHIAKNMTDVSSFWINYVCIRSVGVVFELLQIVPLFFIVILKGRSSYRYTPRQLAKVIGDPPYFQYGKNYGIVLSFFTAALAYSVTAPIVLPFAMIYFGLATTTFKYKMMYIYVTKTETHGAIWPLLYRIVMISVLVFQFMMILILSLKAGLDQIYSLVPLPVLTIVIACFYIRRLEKKSTLKAWVELKNNINRRMQTSNRTNTDEIELQNLESSDSDRTSIRDSSQLLARDANMIASIYTEPTVAEPLWKPMIYDHIKCLVADVYKDHPQKQRILRILYSEKTNQAHANGNPGSNGTDTQTPSTPREKQQLRQNDQAVSIPLSPSSDEINVITTALNEKQQIKQQIEQIEAMYPPSVNPNNTGCYYEPLQGESSGSSSYYFINHVPEGQSSRDPTPTAPTLEEMLDRSNTDVLDNEFIDSEGHMITTRVTQPPPPTYADVISPRINKIQTQTCQRNRRHSA